MRECVLKYDHFENIHRLGKDAKVTIEGAPNVRQVGVCGCVCTCVGCAHRRTRSMKCQSKIGII